MKKKIVLIAATGLFTTAIVAATVNTGKKADNKAVKTEAVKEKKECSKAKKYHCIF